MALYRRRRRLVSRQEYEAITAQRQRERDELHAQPQYAVCRAGKQGWFWVAWPSMPRWHFEGGPEDSRPDVWIPTWEGYAPSEDAALLAATQTTGLPPFLGASHGPGCQWAWAKYHRLDTGYATQLLQRRATQRRLARPPSARTDAQQSRFVYAKSYRRYTPHRVIRESPRFFWVNSEEVAFEDWTQKHPEYLRTYRLDRKVLEAGEELHAYRGMSSTWVLHLPDTAVEEDGYWRDDTVEVAQPTVTGAHACLAALGLAAPCTVDDITRAYRTLARVAHPDTGGSHETFVRLTAHYKAALRLLNEAA